MMRFKASRGLIRNVMRELTFAGFVNARPRSGYVVSAGARNLGGCIGLIVPGVFHEEIFSPICQEISRIAHEEGVCPAFRRHLGGRRGRAPCVNNAYSKQTTYLFANNNFNTAEGFSKAKIYSYEVMEAYNSFVGYAPTTSVTTPIRVSVA